MSQYCVFLEKYIVKILALLKRPYGGGNEMAVRQKNEPVAFYRHAE